MTEKISGRILRPDGTTERVGLTVADGRIADIGRAGGSGSGLDFGDALLLPGAVDVHVHTRSYAGEGIERCTRAAAAGGTTTKDPTGGPFWPTGAPVPSGGTLLCVAPPGATTTTAANTGGAVT